MIEASYAKFDAEYVYRNLLSRRQEIQAALDELRNRKISDIAEQRRRHNQEKRTFLWWYPWKLELLPTDVIEDDIDGWDSYWSYRKYWHEQLATIQRLIDMCERPKRENAVYLCDSHVRLAFTPIKAIAA